MEIQSQADQYGLPERPAANLPAEDHLAGLLNKPPMFSGPSKVEERD